jgi:predicted NBD/HSP70 family sugar kinase
MSINSVGSAVAELVDQKLVVEEPMQGGGPGRPVGMLSVNPAAGRVFGVDLGGRRALATVADLAGGTLAKVRCDVEPRPDRSAILSMLTEIVAQSCGEADISPKELLGLGVGVRGIADTRTGTVVDWPNTPEWADAWRGWKLGHALVERLGIMPVVVEDSVRAMGVTAYRNGSARGRQNLLYVYLGEGIGSCLIADGKPYRGSYGIAGELGHVPVSEHGPWCHCGNQGCLEVMASVPAVLRRLKERLAVRKVSSVLQGPERDELTLNDLVQAVDHKDKLAYQILDETGAYIGHVLSILLNILGPELVILGGPLVQDGGIVLQAVQRQVQLHALPYVCRHCHIVCDPPDEMVGARGAALLTLDALFNSEAHIARLLNQG